ncbi:MAG: hypothetical protein LBT46_00155 [Planctomycetaceae bacterium]|jgi:hypothetical protein|nr:hypothetical protein [Planctomycetaceae bacterium]
MTTTSAPSRFWFGFFAGIITTVVFAGILAAVLLHPHPFLPHHEGETAALIRIHSEPQTFIFEDEAKRLNAGEYRLKVNTQIALMRSPIVAEKTLETTEVADLPIIRQQKDAVQFILRHLETKPIRDSEIIKVSMPQLHQHEAAVIINALVNTYFEFNNISQQDNSASFIRHLNAELRRQTETARLYQDSIRAKMKEAGCVGVSPQTIEDVRQAAIKLTSLQERESVLAKRLSETAKKGESTGEIEKMLNDIQAEITNQTKMVKDSEIAVISASADRATVDADISFDEAQLGRVNKVIDALSERIHKILAERYCPNPIQLLRLAKPDK